MELLGEIRNGLLARLLPQSWQGIRDLLLENSGQEQRSPWSLCCQLPTFPRQLLKAHYHLDDCLIDTTCWNCYLRDVEKKRKKKNTEEAYKNTSTIAGYFGKRIQDMELVSFRKVKLRRTWILLSSQKPELILFLECKRRWKGWNRQR